MADLSSKLARLDAMQRRSDLAPVIPVTSHAAGLVVRRASRIDARDIDWLWKNWLPAGMLGLFAGYGGGGKSTTALHIAAAGSVGGTFPDGQPAPIFNTLIMAAEDSPEHTIRPRLDAMGADIDRIFVMDGVARAGDDPGWVQLRNHAPLIEQAIADHCIGLVIVDPVSSYIGDANSDKESDVRAGITPLVKVAERTGASFLLIRHVSKTGDGMRAASRILGSTAWHDIPRVVWMLGDAPDEHQPESNDDGTRDTRRVLGVVKSNLAAKPPARWCVQPVDGPLRWLPDAAPVAVEECFIAQSGKGSVVRDARAWLAERLAGGSQPTRTVETAAKDAGISPAALKRARAALNVRATKERTGEWVLSLPPGATTNRNGGKVNALHSDEAVKGCNMSVLHAFPSNQGERSPEEGAGECTDDAEAVKAFNPPVYVPLNALHNGTVLDRSTRTPLAEPVHLPPAGTGSVWRVEL